MTSITAYPLVRASAARRESQIVHAVEKVKPQAEFNGEQTTHREASSWICVPAERRKACQSGTVEDGSYWDGPRLKSEFAAQVLGQALVNKTPAASAASAYRKRALVLLPLFDKNV